MRSATSTMCTHRLLHTEITQTTSAPSTQTQVPLPVGDDRCEVTLPLSLDRPPEELREARAVVDFARDLFCFERCGLAVELSALLRLKAFFSG